MADADRRVYQDVDVRTRKVTSLLGEHGLQQSAFSQAGSPFFIPDTSRNRSPRKRQVFSCNVEDLDQLTYPADFTQKVFP